MKFSCREYRKSMELVELQKRLKDGVDNSRVKKEIEDRITFLEKMLDID